MTYWQGLVLGVVQGLTEFLPISSSGHLVVAETAIGLATPGVTVEVALHVATLFAVVFVYRGRLWSLIWGTVRGHSVAWGYVGLLAIGTVPAAVIGLLFADVFERTFDSLLAVGVNFMFTGFVLWSVRHVARQGTAREPKAVGAAGIGIAQMFALFPGISRSGTTVAAGLWLRLEPASAAEFSFVLAIPAIIGAAVLQIPRLSADMASVGSGPLSLSFVSALGTGIVAIKVLVLLLERGAFHRFAFYCWSIGGATMLWAVVR